MKTRLFVGRNTYYYFPSFFPFLFPPSFLSLFYSFLSQFLSFFYTSFLHPYLFLCIPSFFLFLPSFLFFYSSLPSFLPSNSFVIYLFAQFAHFCFWLTWPRISLNVTLKMITQKLYKIASATVPCENQKEKSRFY